MVSWDLADIRAVDLIKASGLNDSNRHGRVLRQSLGDGEPSSATADNLQIVEPTRGFHLNVKEHGEACTHNIIVCSILTWGSEVSGEQVGDAILLYEAGPKRSSASA